MEAQEMIKNRRSIREYSDKPIPKEQVEKIIDAARFAVTARNVQPWEFVVITQAQVLTKIAGLAENGRFIAGAKACIAVFCADTKYYLEDGCAATCNILLAACGLGIGSCWVAGDKKSYVGDVAKLLNVPGGFKLVSLISLGYPKSAESFYPADKRKVQDILHWEKF
ncbi:MAG: nitroreductase family protein [Candidatus Omnitrophica bacterium]|nr:nitroreductase family protein [Candidatus Omnitrophota bacterium]